MAIKKTSIRSDCSKYLAKTMAYFALGRMDEARQWAAVLQQKLIELNLLVDMRQTTCNNGSQSENKTNFHNTKDATMRDPGGEE